MQAIFPLNDAISWHYFILGGKKVASLTDEEGVDSIVARNDNSWACDHPMDFDLTGDFNVRISTINFRVKWRL